MSNILIMNNNYVTAETLNAFTYSSQLAAAPATNVYDKIRRSKVWRSAGQWEITSANKTIKFKETGGGSTLTATIAEATYTTDATFLTAIKTALEVAGDSTYTVTRDTTSQKIKITSNGGGGGGHFQLLCTDVLFTACDVLGYSTGADLTGALTYTAANLRIHTSEWLKFDLGTQLLPEAFAIIGGNVNGLKLSSTATIKLQGNETDVWTAPSYDETLTWNADCIASVDQTGLHTGGLRYWRLHIVDRDNINGYVEISSVYLGDGFAPDLGCVQFPFNWNYFDYGQVNRSEWGSAFTEFRGIVRELNLKWFALTVADTETLMDFVRNYGTTSPFWISLDPNEAFSSDFQSWVIKCHFTEAPGFPLESPGVFSSNWEVREES